MGVEVRSSIAVNEFGGASSAEKCRRRRRRTRPGTVAAQGRGKAQEGTRVGSCSRGERRKSEGELEITYFIGLIKRETTDRGPASWQSLPLNRSASPFRLLITLTRLWHSFSMTHKYGVFLVNPRYFGFYHFIFVSTNQSHREYHAVSNWATQPHLRPEVHGTLDKQTAVKGILYQQPLTDIIS